MVKQRRVLLNKAAAIFDDTTEYSTKQRGKIQISLAEKELVKERNGRAQHAMYRHSTGQHRQSRFISEILDSLVVGFNCNRYEV